MVCMKPVNRIYDTILQEHLSSLRQMAFVSGPRQVGKTTSCRNHADNYANWDNINDREMLLAGPERLANSLGLDELRASLPIALFDELHKNARWKEFLKGFYDSYSDRVKIIVTGSSRLDVYRRIGDSLMGRYFLYRMHPFSVAETMHIDLPDQKNLVRMPSEPDEAEFVALWEHGGYPEPFLKRDQRFSRRWRSMRTQQLIKEDARDLTQIQHVDQLEMLATLLTDRSGTQVVYSNLANEVRVSIDTLRRWIGTLSNLHHGFLLKPWFKNVSRSLRKEPKWYLRDWAGIEDVGARSETFVACHLLKAVDAWNDLGYGQFQLCYLRDKSKREADFIVVRDGSPYFIAEVKHKQTDPSESLKHFQRETQSPFAFQVVIESDYVNADCFSRAGKPLIVPARTFLSQLV